MSIIKDSDYIDEQTIFDEEKIKTKNKAKSIKRMLKARKNIEDYFEKKLLKSLLEDDYSENR